MSYRKKTITRCNDAAKALIRASFRDGKQVNFHLSSISMLPTLEPGDKLSVQLLPADEIYPGNIAILDSKEEWWAHRILRISIDQDGVNFLTKGDNRISFDPVWRHPVEIAIVVSIKRGERCLVTSSWKVRVGGRVIAWLSYIQGITSSNSNTIIQRIGYKLTTPLIKLFSTVTYRLE